MNFGVFDWTILRVEGGPTPEKDRCPDFDLETPRDWGVSRRRQKLFVGVVGHDPCFGFEEFVKRAPKVLFAGI